MSIDGSFSFHQRDQDFDTFLPGFMNGLADGRQRRQHVLRHGCIVESHDGNIPSHVQSMFLGGMQRPNRLGIVECHDGRRPIPGREL